MTCFMRHEIFRITYLKRYWIFVHLDILIYIMNKTNTMALVRELTKMGCTISAPLKKRGGKDLPGYLSKKEIDLVQKTWTIVSTDMMGTGLFMFQRLFERQKDLQKLFKKLLLPSETSAFFFDEVKLQNHALIVMQGLGAAVESLDDSVYLTGILQAMGEKHSNYNVQPEMISLLWPAIRDALKHKLEDEFTPEAELAWRHVFDYISSTMAEGIRNGQNKKMNMT